MQQQEFVPEIPQTLSSNGVIPPVHFTVTGEMVAQFSTLTGDNNYLHTSENYARRSIYRQQIVHGMLPVAFISLFKIFHHKDFFCFVRQLDCQFIEPVFIDDNLSLQGSLSEIQEEKGIAKIVFTMIKRKNGVEAMNGSLQVVFVPSSSISALNGPQNTDDIASEPVAPQISKIMELGLEDIAIDDTDSFPFVLSEQALSNFKLILDSGRIEDKKNVTDIPVHSLYLPDLLTIMLFSTSVGVCIPGKYATFLSFEAKVDEPLTIGQKYSLHGQVLHVSRGTRIIKKNIIITDTNGPQDKALVTGTVKVLVNEPPVVMPKMKELRDVSFDHVLSGKIALITGASRGIGETIAKFLALYGVKVVVNYFRGKNDAERVVDEIISEAGKAIAIQADVTDEEQVKEMIEQIVQEYGGIDILVNNAVGDFKPVPFNRLTWDDIRKDTDIVVKGAFNCSKEVLPYMIKKGAGKIINIGTVATDSPPIHQTKYVIAKSGLVGLTRSLSVEYAAKNIQVNMVAPSFVETDLVSHIPKAYRTKIAQDTPMGRNASPSDIAQAVLFLASSYSSFTTGQKIMVTGGGAPFS